MFKIAIFNQRFRVVPGSGHCDSGGPWKKLGRGKSKERAAPSVPSRTRNGAERGVSFSNINLARKNGETRQTDGWTREGDGEGIKLVTRFINETGISFAKENVEFLSPGIFRPRSEIVKRTAAPFSRNSIFNRPSPSPPP